MRSRKDKGQIYLNNGGRLAKHPGIAGWAKARWRAYCRVVAARSMLEMKLFYWFTPNISWHMSHTWQSEQWSAKGVLGEGGGRGGSWQYWPRHPDTQEQL